MPNPVEFTIQVGALPEGLDTDPQGLLEAFAERLFVTPSVPWSSFTLGAAEPTSDLGPWFKDGQELWVWDDDLAAYKPQVINSKSLGYVVAASDPGAADYDLWFDTSAGAVKWSNGSVWTSIYAAQFANYSTTAEMNAAIAAAIAAIPGTTIVAGQGSFSARPSVQQDVVFGGAGNQTGVITLGTENFDPDSAFASNAFVAPADGFYHFNWGAEIQVSGGSPTQLDISIGLFVGGVLSMVANQIDGGETVNGGVFARSTYIYLSLGQSVDIRYDFTPDAACTVEIHPSYTVFSGYRVR